MATEERKTYLIHSLQVENFKRISAILIRPDGSMVEITGRNGAGKSSALDAIWVAIEGKAVAPTVPVRIGEEKATIRLDLGDLHITRTFTAQEGGGFTTSIKVENGEGARFDKPETILKSLVNSLSLDPLEFERAKPGEQFEILRGFVPKFDFAADAKARKDDFDERTVVNRRAKELRAQAAGIVVPEGASAEEIDVQALTDELASAAQTNSEIDEQVRKRADYAAHTAGLEAERDRLIVEAASIKARLAELEPIIEERTAKLAGVAPLPAKVDIADTQERINAAMRTNEGARLAKQKAAIIESALEAERKSAALTKKIEDRDAARQKAITEAAIPVEGLTIGADDTILLGGVPFAQASDAERLRASVNLAMAMKPKLQVVRIRDGSRLDSQSIALVAQMAAERGFQVWCETVESGRPTAIVIENGAIRQPVAEAAE